MRTPPCSNAGRSEPRHVFPYRTVEPKKAGDERICRRCGTKQVAFGTPPRAKKRLKWYYYP